MTASESSGSSCENVEHLPSLEMPDSGKSVHDVCSSVMTTFSHHLTTCEDCWKAWMELRVASLVQATSQQPTFGIVSSSGIHGSHIVTNNSSWVKKPNQDTSPLQELLFPPQTGTIAVLSSSLKPATCRSKRRRSKR